MAKGPGRVCDGNGIKKEPSKQFSVPFLEILLKERMLKGFVLAGIGLAKYVSCSPNTEIGVCQEWRQVCPGIRRELCYDGQPW